MSERLWIKTADELFNLPGYTDNVDQTKEKRLRVIGHYSFPSMIPCGLKCRQPHYDGVVVELSDDRVTNVGHVCGQQFGERFNIANKNYAERVLKPSVVKAVGEIMNRLATMQSELNGFRVDTNSLCEKIYAFRARFPRLVEGLTWRAHSGDYRVFESVARSSSEIDDLMAGVTGGTRRRAKAKRLLTEPHTAKRNSQGSSV